MSVAPNLTDADRQHISNVAYAIACVMVRKNMLQLQGEWIVPHVKQEQRVHELALELAQDLREEAMAAIRVSGEAVRL